MRTLLNVGRYHLVDRTTYLAQPWAVLAFSFGVNVVIAALIPDQVVHTWGLVTIYLFLLVAGATSMSRWLPFGLTLGISRRRYYQGTVLLATALSVVYGLALALLQVAERASDGWGLRLHFFRPGWGLDGPWYQTWLLSFVLLLLFWVYGMWCGLVFRRWAIPGVIFLLAAQVLVLLAAAVAVSVTNSWSGVGDFFGAVTVPALAGVAAAVAVALGLGGLGTIRRVTV